MRSGAEYIAGLADGREIYLDGERVDDVATHPAFAKAIQVIAGTYDDARSRADLHYTDPGTGETFSGMWRIPREASDLSARRRVHEFWARSSYGLMGRTPDHVASLLSAFAGSCEVFARGGDRYAKNAVDFYEKARREDLYVSYAIVPPQVDRSKSAAEQSEKFIYPGVTEEREDGIVIRGAQMLATSGTMSDYLLLTYIVPLQAGDEDYAISCVMPINTPGLRLYPRRPYGTIATSEFDYPLSSKFDEIDSLVAFDDVFVPWEHVFVYKDVKLTSQQFTDTGAHLLANFQALTRFGVKLQFACGLAMRLAELHGIDKLPPVRGQLGGGVATIATQLEGVLLAAELSPEKRGGILVPSQKFVYTGMSLQRQLVVDLMKWLRELAGGSFICVPSSEASFESPETAADTYRYYQSAGAPADERVQLLKLMWDFVGTEFAGRQLQYEMFYSAAQHISDARVFNSYDWDSARALVQDAIDRGAPLPTRP